MSVPDSAVSIFHPRYRRNYSHSWINEINDRQKGGRVWSEIQLIIRGIVKGTK